MRRRRRPPRPRAAIALQWAIAAFLTSMLTTAACWPRTSEAFAHNASGGIVYPDSLANSVRLQASIWPGRGRSENLPPHAEAKRLGTRSDCAPQRAVIALMSGRVRAVVALLQPFADRLPTPRPSPRARARGVGRSAQLKRPNDADPLDEVAIVTDDQQRTVEAAKCLFEDVERFHVEMVGRLVQDK